MPYQINVALIDARSEQCIALQIAAWPFGFLTV
jgi:hypothetical protein